MLPEITTALWHHSCLFWQNQLNYSCMNIPSFVKCLNPCPCLLMSSCFVHSVLRTCPSGHSVTGMYTIKHHKLKLHLAEYFIVEGRRRDISLFSWRFVWPLRRQLSIPAITTQNVMDKIRTESQGYFKIMDGFWFFVQKKFGEGRTAITSRTFVRAQLRK